jgi:UDP-N-acetylglucosamine--N-acetylmuramyl-(pentapeptide) pyrophosphoryl-undecaprenol N-acetylglucosamine transferase
MDKHIKIVLSGGGTGGTVTPLLAIAREFYRKYNNSSFLFIGTHSGPEKMLAEEVSKDLPLTFVPMLSGKWRRYFSWYNFTDFFNIGGAFFQAIYLLKKEKPDLVISVGAFVSVPLVWAAKFLHIPVLIHQQDLRPGLANRLMAGAASVITVTFSNSLKVYGTKAILTGNPYSLPSLPRKEVIFKKYNLDLVKPLTLIFGGGTGSISINEAVKNNLSELLEVTQIIHVSGTGKLIDESRSGYFCTEFLNHLDLISVMAVSDIIVARPGLGTLTELSALKKASILVPMPNSHQEDNAQACADTGAAIYIEQKDLENKLVRVVSDLLNSSDKRLVLETKMASIIKSGAADAIVDISYKLIK